MRHDAVRVGPVWWLWPRFTLRGQPTKTASGSLLNSCKKNKAGKQACHAQQSLRHTTQTPTYDIKKLVAGVHKLFCDASLHYCCCDCWSRSIQPNGTRKCKALRHWFVRLVLLQTRPTRAPTLIPQTPKNRVDLRHNGGTTSVHISCDTLKLFRKKREVVRIELIRPHHHQVLGYRLIGAAKVSTTNRRPSPVGSWLWSPSTMDDITPVVCSSPCTSPADNRKCAWHPFIYRPPNAQQEQYKRDRLFSTRRVGPPRPTRPSSFYGTEYLW